MHPQFYFVGLPEQAIHQLNTPSIPCLIRRVIDMKRRADVPSFIFLQAEPTLWILFDKHHASGIVEITVNDHTLFGSDNLLKTNLKVKFGKDKDGTLKALSPIAFEDFQM